MKTGFFFQPITMPGTPMKEGIDQLLDEIEYLDELGASEVWIGEHLTAKWEPYAAGDLIIAQAIPRTKQINLCSGGYIPAFYHPGALAFRIMQLDHMAQGRYMCGIAAGSVNTDFQLLNIDPSKGEHRERQLEAIEILLKLWTEHFDGEWTYEGKYWTINNPVDKLGNGPHIRPYTQPHPRLAIAGISPNSESIALAGKYGAIPMSAFFNERFLKTHWDTYAEAAEAAGHQASRDMWRVGRETFVADTDKEARAYVRNSTMAVNWTESILPVLANFGLTKYLKHDESVPDSDVDVDYLIDHLWLVGSPDTVREKLAAVDDELGGFGTFIPPRYDHRGEREPMWHSHELLINEVVAKLPVRV